MKDYYLIFAIVAVWIIFRLIAGQNRDFVYKCRHCQTEFQPSSWQDYLGPHIMFYKYMKCPNCRRWNWTSVVRK
jgi:DNA-directed RNA polymerase subunit RPC12/RpoP